MCIIAIVSKGQGGARDQQVNISASSGAEKWESVERRKAIGNGKQHKTLTEATDQQLVSLVDVNPMEK